MKDDYDLILLEILKISRDLLVNEYIDRRAQDHNRWLIDSEHLWKTQRLRLAYPDFPPYPNDLEILNRAQRLLEFVKTNSSLLEKNITIDNTINNDFETNFITTTETSSLSVITEKPELVNKEIPVSNDTKRLLSTVLKKLI